MVASYAFAIVLLPCLAIRVGNVLGSETILPLALLFLCWLLVQALFDASAQLWCDTIRSNSQATNVQLVTSLYALCIQKMAPTACALLEFTEAPLRIFRLSGVVGIGTPTSTSPALDIAALCLPAAIFTQTVTSDTAASQSAISFLTAVKSFPRLRAAWYCIMA